MSRYDALQLALSQEPIVEVSPTAEPPVCRIIDYGKFLFEQNKKAHTAKRKQKQTQVKEVKFRPGLTKAISDQAQESDRFLTEGDKAKVTLRFRAGKWRTRHRTAVLMRLQRIWHVRASSSSR